MSEVAQRGRLGAILAMLMLLASCGSATDPSDSNGSASPGPTSVAGIDPSALAVTVASYDIAQGAPRRFLAGVETSDRRLVTFATVDMKFAFAGTGKGEASGPELRTTGRYLPVAGSDVPEPPPIKPRIVTASQSRGVYATMVGFDRPGFWEVEVTADLDGKLRRGTGAFQVLESARLPDVGDAALATENLTISSSDAPPAAVDSRAAGDPDGTVPNPEIHSTTIAAALAAKRPVLAVFATPVYCTSRFCGPVTDLVAELARDYSDRAAFVHVEIWRNFQDKVINKAAAEWLLRDGNLTEPWIYLIGADGRIQARFDNVANRSELEPLLAALPTSAAMPISAAPSVGKA